MRAAIVSPNRFQNGHCYRGRYVFSKAQGFLLAVDHASIGASENKGSFVADIEEINQLIWSMGVKFRAEMVRPATLTPRQFPVSQSFTLAATHNFLTLPNAINRILPRTMPEDI